MKIALVHMRHAHTGGTERYLNMLAMELAESGHDVSIVCRSHEGLDHPKVRFITLKSLALGKAHRMWRFAKAVDKHVQSTDYDLVYALGKTWAHDVIRIGGGSHKRFLERMPLRKRRCKDKVSMELEMRAFQSGCYRMVVANSEMCAIEIAEDFAIPREKITIIHNSVSLERFQADSLQKQARNLRNDFHISDETLLYLFLGTGYERKGLDLLLQAFSQVAFGEVQAKLLVVGYDSNQARFKKMAESLGINEEVVFAGGRRDAEVCYAAADVYVLPTRYDPFANTTLEALASGLPVITTATNGGSEVLKPDIGDTVPAENIDALKIALERWRDAGLRMRARSAAIAQAALYDHKAVMAKTRRLLEQLATDTSQSEQNSSRAGG